MRTNVSYHVGVSHSAQKLIGESFVVGAETSLLLADLSKNVGMVSNELNGPGDGRGGGILTGEKEIKNSEGEFLNKQSTTAPRDARIEYLVGLERGVLVLQVVLHPVVQQAKRLLALHHAGLGSNNSLLQEHDDLFSGLDGLPEGGPWKGNGERQHTLVHSQVELSEEGTVLHGEVRSNEHL